MHNADQLCSQNSYPPFKKIRLSVFVNIQGVHENFSSLMFTSLTDHFVTHQYKCCSKGL